MTYTISLSVTFLVYPVNRLIIKQHSQKYSAARQTVSNRGQGVKCQHWVALYYYGVWLCMLYLKIIARHLRYILLYSTLLFQYKCRCEYTGSYHITRWIHRKLQYYQVNTQEAIIIIISLHCVARHISSLD